jgi:hypothetical protein
LTVNPIPAVAIANLASSYYNNDTTLHQLEGSPIGGVFQGLGITYTNFFSPLGLEPGTYNVTYFYVDPMTGCSNSTTISTRILQGVFTQNNSHYELLIILIACPVILIGIAALAIVLRRRQKNKYKQLELGVDFGSRDINTNIAGNQKSVITSNN